jgi:hypothetical protein
VYSSRLVLLVTMLFIACSGKQDSVNDITDTDVRRVTEVSSDITRDLESSSEIAEVVVPDVVEVVVPDVVDVNSDLQLTETVDLIPDLLLEDMGEVCPLPPSVNLDLPRFLTSDGNVFLSALQARPGGGYIASVNTDGQKLIWDGQEVAEAKCPTEDGCSDALILWIDALLEVERVVRLHGDGVERGLGVTIDAGGIVMLVGSTDSVQLKVGQATLPGNGQLDGLVVAFDPGGEILWALRTGGELDDAWNVIASDGSGGAVVGGWFESATVEIAGETLVGQDENCILLDCGDLLLAGIDATGTVTWARLMGGNQGERYVSLYKEDGAFNVVGSFGSWGLDLGGELIPMQETICGPMYGCSDLFAGRYGLSGEHIWSKGFGGDLLDVALSGAPAPGGGLLFVGEFSSSSLDVGGGPMVNNGDHESFVAQLNGQGDHIWSMQADAFLRVAAAGPGGTTLVIGRQAPYQLGFAECLHPKVVESQILAGSISAAGELAGYAAFGAFEGPLQMGGLAISGDTAAVGGTFRGLLELPGAGWMDEEVDSVFFFLLPVTLTLPEAI